MNEKLQGFTFTSQQVCETTFQRIILKFSAAGSDLHGEARDGQERRGLADDLGSALHPGLVWQLQRQRTNRMRTDRQLLDHITHL